MSRSKTLIHNWVEERQCEALSLEKDKWNEDSTLCTKIHYKGHEGLLTTQTSVLPNSTVKDSYTPPTQCPVATTGIKQEQLRQSLFKLASEEQEIEQSLPPLTPDYTTTTKDDYHKEYVPAERSSCRDKQHKLSDTPTSYWSDNHHLITGVSAVAHKDKPFHRNTHFSKDIQERLDE